MVHAKPLVVDVDSHVMEPPDLWQTYIEPEYRHRAIRIERGADGVETLMVDDKALLFGRLAALGGAEHDAVQTFTDPELTYLDGCPKASYDTAARVALLDERDVDTGVVFPTIGILWDKEDDPEMAMAYARLQQLAVGFRQAGTGPHSAHRPHSPVRRESRLPGTEALSEARFQGDVSCTGARLRKAPFPHGARMPRANHDADAAR